MELVIHRDKLESSTERKREKEGNGEETEERSRKKRSVWRQKKTTQTEEKCGVEANKISEPNEQM